MHPTSMSTPRIPIREWSHPTEESGWVTGRSPLSSAATLANRMPGTARKPKSTPSTPSFNTMNYNLPHTGLNSDVRSSAHSNNPSYLPSMSLGQPYPPTAGASSADRVGGSILNGSHHHPITSPSSPFVSTSSPRFITENLRMEVEQDMENWTKRAAYVTEQNKKRREHELSNLRRRLEETNLREEVDRWKVRVNQLQNGMGYVDPTALGNNSPRMSSNDTFLASGRRSPVSTTAWNQPPHHSSNSLFQPISTGGMSGVDISNRPTSPIEKHTIGAVKPYAPYSSMLARLKERMIEDTPVQPDIYVIKTLLKDIKLTPSDSFEIQDLLAQSCIPDSRNPVRNNKRDGGHSHNCHHHSNNPHGHTHQAASRYPWPLASANVPAREVSASQRSAILSMFERYDHHKTGYIDRKDILALVTDLGGQLCEVELLRATETLTSSLNNETYSLADFVTWWATYPELGGTTAMSKLLYQFWNSLKTVHMCASRSISTAQAHQVKNMVYEATFGRTPDNCHNNIQMVATDTTVQQSKKLLGELGLKNAPQTLLAVVLGTDSKSPSDLCSRLNQTAGGSFKFSAHPTDSQSIVAVCNDPNFANPLPLVRTDAHTWFLNSTVSFSSDTPLFQLLSSANGKNVDNVSGFSFEDKLRQAATTGNAQLSSFMELSGTVLSTLNTLLNSADSNHVFNNCSSCKTNMKFPPLPELLKQVQQGSNTDVGSLFIDAPAHGTTSDNFFERLIAMLYGFDLNTYARTMIASQLFAPQNVLGVTDVEIELNIMQYTLLRNYIQSIQRVVVLTPLISMTVSVNVNIMETLLPIDELWSFALKNNITPTCTIPKIERIIKSITITEEPTPQHPLGAVDPLTPPPKHSVPDHIHQYDGKMPHTRFLQENPLPPSLSSTPKRPNNVEQGRGGGRGRGGEPAVSVTFSSPTPVTGSSTSAASALLPVTKMDLSSGAESSSGTTHHSQHVDTSPSPFIRTPSKTYSKPAATSHNVHISSSTEEYKTTTDSSHQHNTSPSNKTHPITAYSSSTSLASSLSLSEVTTTTHNNIMLAKARLHSLSTTEMDDTKPHGRVESTHSSPSTTTTDSYTLVPSKASTHSSSSSDDDSGAPHPPPPGSGGVPGSTALPQSSSSNANYDTNVEQTRSSNNQTQQQHDHMMQHHYHVGGSGNVTPLRGAGRTTVHPPTSSSATVGAYSDTNVEPSNISTPDDMMQQHYHVGGSGNVTPLRGSTPTASNKTIAAAATPLHAHLTTDGHAHQLTTTPHQPHLSGNYTPPDIHVNMMEKQQRQDIPEIGPPQNTPTNDTDHIKVSAHMRTPVGTVAGMEAALKASDYNGSDGGPAFNVTMNSHQLLQHQESNRKPTSSNEQRQGDRPIRTTENLAATHYSSGSNNSTITTSGEHSVETTPPLQPTANRSAVVRPRPPPHPQAPSHPQQGLGHLTAPASAVRQGEDLSTPSHSLPSSKEKEAPADLTTVSVLTHDNSAVTNTFSLDLPTEKIDIRPGGIGEHSSSAKTPFTRSTMNRSTIEGENNTPLPLSKSSSKTLSQVDNNSKASSYEEPKMDSVQTRSRTNSNSSTHIPLTQQEKEQPPIMLPSMTMGSSSNSDDNTNAAIKPNCAGAVNQQQLSGVPHGGHSTTSSAASILSSTHEGHAPTTTIPNNHDHPHIGKEEPIVDVSSLQSHTQSSSGDHNNNTSIPSSVKPSNHSQFSSRVGTEVCSTIEVEGEYNVQPPTGSTDEIQSFYHHHHDDFYHHYHGHVTTASVDDPHSTSSGSSSSQMPVQEVVVTLTTNPLPSYVYQPTTTTTTTTSTLPNNTATATAFINTSGGNQTIQPHNDIVIQYQSSPRAPRHHNNDNNNHSSHSDDHHDHYTEHCKQDSTTGSTSVSSSSIFSPSIGGGTTNSTHNSTPVDPKKHQDVATLAPSIVAEKLWIHIQMVRSEEAIQLMRSYPRVNEAIRMKPVDSASQSLLHGATFNKLHSVMDELLSYNVDANCVDDYGATALHYAAFNGDVAAVEKIISHNQAQNIQVNINMQDSDGVSPLQNAVLSNKAAAVKLLLDYAGDSVHTSTADLLDLAKTDCSDESIVQMLQHHINQTAS